MPGSVRFKMYNEKYACMWDDNGGKKWFPVSIASYDISNYKCYYFVPVLCCFYVYVDSTCDYHSAFVKSCDV